MTKSFQRHFSVTESYREESDKLRVNHLVFSEKSLPSQMFLPNHFAVFPWVKHMMFLLMTPNIGFGSLGELFSEPFPIFPALFLAQLVSFQGMVVTIGLEVPVTGEVSIDQDALSTAAKFPFKMFPTAHQPGLRYPNVTHPSLGWVHMASEKARRGSHLFQRQRRFQSSWRSEGSPFPLVSTLMVSHPCTGSSHCP